jgi:hypothetical protein
LADLERHLFDALQPHEAALQLLMTLPGIDRLAAAKLVVEIGVDMAAFRTAGRRGETQCATLDQATEEIRLPAPNGLSPVRPRPKKRRFGGKG